MLQCELLCVPTSGSGFYQWVWILSRGLDFASGSGYENTMGQTPCCIMWSTHNHGIIPHILDRLVNVQRYVLVVGVGSVVNDTCSLQVRLAVTCNQGCADMKFLPDTDIRYFYHLKSDTQYQYDITWNYLWSKKAKVKSQRCNSFIMQLLFNINWSL